MTTQKRKTPGFYRKHPVIDPDFDNLGGELTLAQIRDPGLTLAQIWNPISPTGGDPIYWYKQQRERLRDQHNRLRLLARRLKAAYKLRIPRAHERVLRLSQRLEAASSFEAQIACKQELLQKLAKRFLAAQLKTYPKFNFGRAFPAGGYCKCNKCIPYNGHHTINYWATGQTDCW
jgi:hypothetical protein